MNKLTLAIADVVSIVCIVYGLALIYNIFSLYKFKFINHQLKQSRKHLIRASISIIFILCLVTFASIFLWIHSYNSYLGKEPPHWLLTFTFTAILIWYITKIKKAKNSLKKIHNLFENRNKEMQIPQSQNRNLFWWWFVIIIGLIIITILEYLK